jgi:hypothetical protein
VFYVISAKRFKTEYRTPNDGKHISVVVLRWTDFPNLLDLVPPPPAPPNS